MELSSNQKVQIRTLLNDIKRVLVKELTPDKSKKFTGHIEFDVNCTSGGIASTDVKITRFESIK